MAGRCATTPSRFGWLPLALMLFPLGYGTAVQGPGAPGPAASAGTQAERPSEIDIAFGGDVLLGEDMNTYVARHGPVAPLAAVTDLRGADLAIVNLESVVALGADAVDTGHVADYYFLGRPETLGLLEAAGIDAVSTANNHARDFGVAALEQEDSLLTAMGIAHPGMGRTVEEACAPAYLESRGVRVALFAVNTTDPAYATGDASIGTCYLSPRDHGAWERAYRDAFADAHRRAHVVLAMPHFRASFEHAPDPSERDVARLLIDLGADAVLGDGAHALQGIEIYRDRPIIHDAGSLLFNFPDADESAVFVLTVGHAGVVGIRTVPLVTERNRTRLADAGEARATLAATDERSRTLGSALTNGAARLAPPTRDEPTIVPAVGRTDPGPAPGRLTAPPPSCSVATVPADAALAPVALGPLTLVGARVPRAQLDGPALIWLETFWRVDAPVTADLSIAPQAVPRRGTTWLGVHEPCDWAWPTSRWRPGLVYRDRFPLRPPPEVQRMGGLPALVSMTGYGRLAVSVGVQDDGRSLGQSDELRSVVLDPALTARLAIGTAALGLTLVVVAFAVWRRPRARRKG